MPYADEITFTVTCTMRRRWAEQFAGMLLHMARLGSWGSSREVTFYADGDGDFRPRFSLPPDIQPAEPTSKDVSGNVSFDAG